jgi:hypothetical protein
MNRGQMGTAQSHLKGPVPQQLTDGTKIRACHHQPTGKGVRIAMPTIVSELGIFENPIEPLSLIAAADYRPSSQKPTQLLVRPIARSGDYS